MNAKQLAILLAILLAVSVYYNIECRMEEGTGPYAWDKDSVDRKIVHSLTDRMVMCMKGVNSDSCSSVVTGMDGGSVELEKLGLISVDPMNVNCLSYYFIFEDGSSGTAGSLKLLFHGDKYDETGKIISGPGPYYTSDMLCPVDCPN